MNALLEETFPDSEISVSSHGNVYSAIAYLHSLATEELMPSELAARDPDIELLVTARVTKAVPNES